MVDYDQLIKLAKALELHEVDYVLVGALALGLHGLVRATQDIDLFIRPDGANVECLKRALQEVWPDPEIASITVEDLAGEYPTVRYLPPGETIVVDLIARLGTAFQHGDIESETVEIEGVKVRVATPRMLYRMKRDTVREQDRIDAAALQKKFGL